MGGLSPQSVDDDVRALFTQAGFNPSSVKVARDKKRNRSRCFAFVELPSEEEGESAIQKLNGADLAGKTVKVSTAAVKREVHGGFGKPEGFRGIHAYSDRTPKRRGRR